MVIFFVPAAGTAKGRTGRRPAMRLTLSPETVIPHQIKGHSRIKGHFEKVNQNPDSSRF